MSAEHCGCGEVPAGHWGYMEREGQYLLDTEGWREGQCLLLDTGDGAQKNQLELSAEF